MWWSRFRKRHSGTLSIRTLLLWQLGVVFAGGLIVLYWAATSYARFAADSSFDRMLLGSASSIAETLSISASDQISADIPYAALDMLSAAPDDRVFYRIVGTDSVTITGYPDLPQQQATPSRSRPAGQVKFFDAEYSGETVRFVVTAREVRIGGTTGRVLVQVGQTREARRELAQDLTVRALLPIAGLTVIAVVVVWASVGYAVRPLQAIGTGLARRPPSDLSPIRDAVPDEITPLVSSINQFMSRLDNNMGVLRNFIATAAHQLRTPLTALLVQLQSAERAAGKERSNSIAAAQQSANRLARLVDQLLSDAMVAHRADEARAVSIDLKKLVEISLHDSLPIYTEADVRFTTTLESAPMVGDDVMLGEAIKNLVHNALTHGVSDDDGDNAIDIVLRSERDGWLLTVSDRGPGAESTILTQLGDRFLSGSKSRGGAGLGLAIIKQVAESHDGSFNLANRPERGLEASLWLPAR
jgi:two-component system, OmpR family, sensor histidine kinase TctE